jgi:hypothetical protein
VILAGNRLSASASALFLPGWYLMSKWNAANEASQRCPVASNFDEVEESSCQCSYPRICQQLLAIRAPYRRVRRCPGCCFVSGAR